MHNQPQSNRYTEILDELQLQSWQLELVISGFAIFGLFAVLDPIFDWFTQLSLQGFWKGRLLIIAVYLACILTIINLIVHVLLRALWIGAVGVRSVSGEIDFSALRFSEPITAHLKNKIGSFDTFIEKLENYSSVIFGLSFLIVFMTLGIFTLFVLFLSALEYIGSFGLGETSQTILSTVFSVFFLVSMAIIFIDFVTRGWFKKKGGRFYLLFYRITSILTLSVLYRPLLYNFWDNPFGKKLMFWLIPVYIFGVYFGSANYVYTHYLSYHEEATDKFALRRNYVDMVAETGDFIGYAAIPSKTIESNFLELTMPHGGFLERMMFEYDPLLKPKKSRIGFHNLLSSYFHWSFGTYEVTLQEDITFINAVNRAFRVSIDSVPIQEEFIVAMEKNESYTFKKMIPLSKFKEGKHVLSIQRYMDKNDSTLVAPYATIPFWYFPSN